MTRAYVFAKAAAADLRAIARYTSEHWGEEQAPSCMALLDEAAAAVAAGRGVFKDLDALHPGLRAVKVGSHFVFCLVRPRRPALVLAILHERMDLIARLKARLPS